MSLLAAQAALMAASGGGGGGAGSPPNTYAGLTFWYDGDNSAHYSGDTTTSGTPVNDGSLGRADSAGSISRILWRGSGGTIARKIPVVGVSDGFYYSAKANYFDFAVKPSGSNAPSTYISISSLLSAANAALIFAVRVDSANADTGAAYNNSRILGDHGGYVGLHCYQSGGTIHFQAYNWDGNEDVVSVSEAAGTWAIITMKHSGGQLLIRKNGGAWQSIASGNTTDLTGGAKVAPGFIGAISQFCTYNANRSDSELLEVERYFGAKVGITI